MRALLVAALLSAGAVAHAQTQGLKLIRGDTPIPETNASDTYRMDRRDRPIARNFEKQPPVIPHNIKGYQITSNVNMCMACHGKRSAPTSGATPVGKSHYLDRDEKEQPNISARRYFCLQCHVPQHDAPALVGNTFTPAAGFVPKGAPQ
jgi:cytochrome c-type protein NapB